VAIKITWALGLLGKNPTFPAQSIHVAHRKIEFYFDVKHEQKSSGIQQWYYVSNIYKNAFAFNRTSGSPRGIHFPPNTNYGNPPNLVFIADAIMHERGHNTSTQHSPNRDDIMFWSIWPGKSMQKNERSRWFGGWPKRPGAPDPWAPGEADRWKSMTQSEVPVEPYTCSLFHGFDVNGLEITKKEDKPTFKDKLLGFIPIRRQWVPEDPDEIEAMMLSIYPNMYQ
jgi:hypothetical protein